MSLKIQPNQIKHYFFEFLDKSKKSSVLDNKKGLMNLGNTCYMNSLLQIFYNTELFKRNLMLCDPYDKLGYMNPVFQLQNLFA